MFLAVFAFAAVTPRPMPDMAISAVDGTKIQLQKYKGKMILVALVSTQCGDCIETLNIMNRLQREFGPRGFQALSAAVNIDAPKETKSFVDRYRPAFPFGYLDQGGLVKLADVKTDDRPYVPILLFIDKKGTVRFQYFGDHPIVKQGEKGIRSIVEGLLR
jgi:peroxiredoxin